jgi:hypothetical protein
MAIDTARRPRSREFKDWLRNLTFESKPHYLAYASSFVITCLLFVSILYELKPKLVIVKQPENIPILLPKSPINDTLPSVQSANAIVELTSQAYQQSQTKDLFVVAEITSEGHAKLIELVDSPNNPQLERHVDAALKRAYFKPATRAGRPIKSRMLLLIQTIDVRG